MKTLHPADVPVPERHQLLLGTIGPRPIAFASTVDENGVANLAPYSFFNVFSSNPPTLVFSSNRKVKDNATKDTLHNVQATGEVVINVVNYTMLRQMTLASIEYPPGVNEFEKAGFTPLKSELVQPSRVAESPAQYECKVKQIIPLGTEGGAGHLIICEAVLMHFSEEIFDEQGKIDPQRVDLMARMGRAFYCRAHGDNVFPIVQPVHKIGIGFDRLPKSIRQSTILTGNELAELAALEALPNQQLLAKVAQQPEVAQLRTTPADPAAYHQLAQQWIQQGKAQEALALLLLAQ